MMKHRFLVAGCLLTVPVLAIGYVSGGFGHGGYVAAQIVLPFACLTLGSWVALVILLALIQWPIYGWIIDRSTHKGWSGLAVAAVHLSLCGFLLMKGIA